LWKGIQFVSQEEIASPLEEFSSEIDASSVVKLKSQNYVWPVIAMLTAGALCILGVASPPIALGMGITIALALHNPWRTQTHVAAKWLLQACVVLLGFTMNLRTVLTAGADGAIFAAISIAVTLGAGIWLGKRFGVERKASLLISVGTAICGGSAIAAVASVVDADQAALSVAMGTVFILNAVALCVFVPIGHALGMSQTQFGTWAGIAIHDISSVVAAGARYGPHALTVATAVKLSRALWIIPITIVVAMKFDSGKAEATGKEVKKSAIKMHHIPWFIGIFLIASVVRTFVPAIHPFSGDIDHISAIGIALTLLMIGLGLSKETLKAVGFKPMLQGILLWLLIASGALIAIRLGA
jgi:uncharacterized integral membrane protein (TIGR00698 family)